MVGVGWMGILAHLEGFILIMFTDVRWFIFIVGDHPLGRGLWAVLWAVWNGENGRTSPAFTTFFFWLQMWFVQLPQVTSPWGRILSELWVKPFCSSAGNFLIITWKETKNGPTQIQSGYLFLSYLSTNTLRDTPLRYVSEMIPNYVNLTRRLTITKTFSCFSQVYCNRNAKLINILHYLK